MINKYECENLTVRFYCNKMPTINSLHCVAQTQVQIQLVKLQVAYTSLSAFCNALSLVGASNPVWNESSRTESVSFHLDNIGTGCTKSV
jgi:hypothetical protein